MSQVDFLIDANFNREQAQAINKAISESIKAVAKPQDQSDFVTNLEFKNGLKGLENTLIKWMIGTAIGILIIVFSVTFTVVQMNTNSINQRIGDVNQRIDGIDQRMNAMNQKMDSINQRMNAVDQKMNNIEQRMNTLEKGINENRVLIKKVLANTS